MTKVTPQTFNKTNTSTSGDYFFTWSHEVEDKQGLKLKATIRRFLLKRLDLNKLEKEYILEHLAYLKEPKRHTKKVHKLKID